MPKYLNELSKSEHSGWSCLPLKLLGYIVSLKKIFKMYRNYSAYLPDVANAYCYSLCTADDLCIPLITEARVRAFIRSVHTIHAFNHRTTRFMLNSALLASAVCVYFYSAQLPFRTRNTDSAVLHRTSQSLKIGWNSELMRQ